MRSVIVELVNGNQFELEPDQVVQTESGKVEARALRDQWREGRFEWLTVGGYVEDKAAQPWEDEGSEEKTIGTLKAVWITRIFEVL